ncbi:hypothetical protein JAAARDRAFT_210160 [Jaapia argillacea MUCL 33604]|uniref:Uncharacterized protein n=1 Tax=Jaapia argillacea MUCL 33604 TaxID=933084 RepID=A0A067PSB9_9AGAM|nr:hypothetical protein JAAARDRAFT_210160 [Jaapia argillacea MUCL 33604]
MSSCQPENSRFSSGQSLSTLPLPALYRNCASLAVVRLSNVAVASDDVASQRFRMFLHEVLTALKVDEGIIRDAQCDDEAQILSRLQSVLQSESCKKEVLLLENENAERFLVLLQDVIDNFPIDDDLRRAVQRFSINLSQASEKLPASLLLRGVVTSNDRHVGGGGFADIFVGKYAHQDVALKRLRIFEGPQEKVRIKKMFFREALIWHRLRHPRVLPFLGIDTESFAPHICIVSSWIRNRDVMRYLARNGLGSLDTHRVLAEVAEGLQYLHKQGVVHGDLRGGNIFLDDSCHALLADFGLTNFADATKVVTTVHRDGSTRWMSPELLDPKKFGISFRRTFASDVYAFGCVCLEVLTGERPFSEISDDRDFLVAFLRAESTVQPIRPDLGESLRQMVLDRLWPLILLCLAQDPRDRPSTLRERGSLLDLVTTAGIMTTEPEVKIPTSICRRLDDEFVLELGGVSEGLQYLHKQRVVHGDLHRGNIVLDGSGHALLVDFGITIPADATKVVTTVRRGGSTRWMLLALEKLGLSFRRTFASDLYVFGCLAFEVLTGEQLFSDVLSDVEFLMTFLISQSPAQPDLDETVLQTVLDKLRIVILWLLAQHPRDRSHTVSRIGSPPEPVVTAALEVKDPTVTGGTDGSLSIIATPFEQPTLADLLLAQSFAPVDVSTLPFGAFYRGYRSLRPDLSHRSSDMKEPEIGETLIRRVNALNLSVEHNLLSPRATHGESEGEPFPCRKCDKTFHRIGDLNQHVRNTHRDSASTSAIEHQPPSQTSSVIVGPSVSTAGSRNYR